MEKKITDNVCKAILLAVPARRYVGGDKIF